MKGLQKKRKKERKKKKTQRTTHYKHHALHTTQNVNCVVHPHSRGDIYFVCIMEPITHTISIDTGEIAECRWMEVMMNHIYIYNLFFLTIEICI